MECTLYDKLENNFAASMTGLIWPGEKTNKKTLESNQVLGQSFFNQELVNNLCATEGGS